MPEQPKTPQAPAAKPAPQKPTNKVSGLELVRFRNFFYRDVYRKIMTIFLISFGVNLTLIGFALSLFFIKPSPVYFATNSNGSLISILALDKPFTEEQTPEFIDWTVHAAIASYSYDFTNWKNQLDDVQQYYNDAGFRNFLSALVTTRNLDTMVAKKYVVTATVSDSDKQDLISAAEELARNLAVKNPTVTSITNKNVRIKFDGIERGHFVYKVRFPMLVKYTSSVMTEEKLQPIWINMRIGRVSKTQTPDGLAIAQFIAEDRGS